MNVTSLRKCYDPNILHKLISYLLLAHPVVYLLCVPVKELQVHALLILLPAQLPQLQKRHLLFRQDAQLNTNQSEVNMMSISEL